MANETKSDTSNFNVTLAGMWEQKSGNVMSLAVDERLLEQLQKAVKQVEIGGKLIVKRLSEESRSKFKDPKKAPTHFLEYITKESVEAFTARNTRNSL